MTTLKALQNAAREEFKEKQKLTFLHDGLMVIDYPTDKWVLDPKAVSDFLDEQIRIAYSQALTDLHARIKEKMPENKMSDLRDSKLSDGVVIYSWGECLSQSLTAIDEAYEELKKV